MTQLSFDHVHYRSSDFDVSRQFYVDIMGAIELPPAILAGKENLQFALGGVTLLFAQASAELPPPVPATTRLGVYHIAFLVEDCVAATLYYEERGAEVAVKPFQASSDLMASFLAAPDGMWLELKQILNSDDVKSE
jgi:catechol 2,3-dioxygenase-like lactoylglutathione lyase family enzyme